MEAKDRDEVARYKTEGHEWAREHSDYMLFCAPYLQSVGMGEPGGCVNTSVGVPVYIPGGK